MQHADLRAVWLCAINRLSQKLVIVCISIANKIILYPKPVFTFAFQQFFKRSVKDFAMIKLEPGLA